ncbi:MAG: hypothetical protein IPG79_05550 [Saprospiraceae bacterium]|nr:hypothetical protein [Saprospiraceae bacterium]
MDQPVLHAHHVMTEFRMDRNRVDCGGPNCPACPTCNDGIQNGQETGVDWQTCLPGMSNL